MSNTYSDKSLSSLRRYCRRMARLYSRLGRTQLASAYSQQSLLIALTLASRGR